jgi:hypothetical protein
VVEKVRERLAVSKQGSHKFDVEKFNLRKLNELKVRKHYHIKITKRSAAWEDLSERKDIHRDWKNIKENIKTTAKECLGLYELKHHKTWFDEKCLDFLDQRKQTKMQWLQNPNQKNADNLNNVRREASRHFRNKKKAYLTAKIDKIETNSKIKKNMRDFYRGINDLKEGYQPRNNIVKDEKCDLVTDPNNTLNRWRKEFSQFFSVHGVRHIRQTEIYTTEPLVPELNVFEDEIAIES